MTTLLRIPLQLYITQYNNFYVIYLLVKLCTDNMNYNGVV